jgi:hypothetical protein
MTSDSEINAEIVFDDGAMIEVQSTVAEVTSQIEGQKRMALPMIRVSDRDGNEVWINATHIRMISPVEGLG